MTKTMSAELTNLTKFTKIKNTTVYFALPIELGNKKYQLDWSLCDKQPFVIDANLKLTKFETWLKDFFSSNEINALEKVKFNLQELSKYALMSSYQKQENAKFKLINLDLFQQQNSKKQLFVFTFELVNDPQLALSNLYNFAMHFFANYVRYQNEYRLTFENQIVAKQETQIQSFINLEFVRFVFDNLNSSVAFSSYFDANEDFENLGKSQTFAAFQDQNGSAEILFEASLIELFKLCF
ncbi:hypothetical protein [Mycoplasmopsis columbinasalis]|uniref:Uncharacterized protein n=1 Tax=Mycoplasmopsis columbinasalis TaxID=114880 RepID=A0A449B9X3_9BACT|nr:hypothetical protein [Mycoplasmopsis columbinasalis]VEU77964.1 Uncharacterised protein [Mycoplasmopsis columbinasalis]